jgi:hypothetical protein
MRKAITIGLLATGVLTGCSDQVWVKAGMTQTEYQQDSSECAQDARRSTGSFSSGVESTQVAKNIVAKCMSARGYTLQKADSVDPALKLVNCKYRAVEEVQRMSAESCTKSGGTVVEDKD